MQEDAPVTSGCGGVVPPYPIVFKFLQKPLKRIPLNPLTEYYFSAAARLIFLLLSGTSSLVALSDRCRGADS